MGAGIAGTGRLGTVVAAPLPVLGGGLGLQALHGQVNFPCRIQGDDHDLHVLPLRQVLADVVDIGIGHL